MTLSRQAIIDAPDAVIEKVPVPEWGDDLYIKALSGIERDDFEASVRRNGVMVFTNYRAKLLVRVLVNENGTRIFSDQDARALGKKNAKIISRLFDKASELSGMSDDEETEGNSEEETASETAAGSDSPSNSPAPSPAPETNSFAASAAAS
ncbi:hypothetical protein RVR_5829 [Actinacidiphila reveromycinica]|uniref:Tail assembly chaperone n=1 Tax=Actinacidiphila reveromycinica TaxID=659352 RepID=A0A7U3UV30_9ACTN|nr:phage tail assembly chaperone [Streptomyces sp. SN-593]BBA99281.1 hypothetical protein RVR_5829 [Streptomyces sp. SN-593]